MPGADRSHLYLVGYSNGGKVAYGLVCQRPGLATAVAIINAVSVSPCPGGAPAKLLLVAGTADPEIPLPASGTPTLSNSSGRTYSDQVAAWLRRDGCACAGETQVAGMLTRQLWTACRAGTSVEIAAYRGGDHGIPPGGADTPSAAEVVWSYLRA